MDRLIVAGMVGVMLFFAAAVAPTTFRVLPAEWSAKYLRVFFPRYFACLGAASALGALIAARPYPRFVLGGCALLFFLSLWPLTPAINRARDAGNQSRFNTLHHLSVTINVLQMLGLLLLLWANP